LFLINKSNLLMLASLIMLTACGGGDEDDGTTTATTSVDVFDGAAIGCAVSTDGASATENGNGAYTFTSALGTGTVVSATGCRDSDTQSLLPKLSGVVQSGAVVISPITTLIVVSALASDPTATSLSSDVILAAVESTIISLGLTGYDPIDPATANYVAAAKADTTGTSTAAIAMRVSLAISTLLKSVEVSAGLANASAAVSAVSQAIVNSLSAIDLTQATEIETVMTAAQTIAPAVAIAIQTASDAIANIVALISSASGNITIAIEATTIVSEFLNTADETTITDTTTITVLVTAVTNNPPVAADDSYDTFGNTLLEVGVTPSGSIALTVSGSVLDNDSDLDVADTLTVTLETGPVSGAVNLDALGNFTYVPAVDLTAITDTFVYRVSDGSGSATATVSINIMTKIWYVDNRSSGGIGTSDNPFATLSDAEFVVADGDTIYIANGDGTTAGLDAGLTLAVPNVSVIGEGEALVIFSTTLAAAGIAPTITNTGGAGMTLNTANNTSIMGLTIDGALSDGLVIDDSTRVFIDGITISNSGESAIQGSGADVELILTDVIIDTVDVTDPAVSDDAIFIAATSSSSLTITGGSISGVPGTLGDGIVLVNADVTNAVTMSLDIRSGVNLSDIGQDGIKLDNDNGVMDVQIGGATIEEGNIFDVGFRGIQIQTDADPTSTSSRTNRILIQNNNITSGNEGIQIRNISDISVTSILDNTLMRSLTGNVSDLIDIQAELTAAPQVRINRNDISNVGGSDGIKVRVFDRATLTMEALNNSIDGPVEGFDFDVIETNSAIMSPTTLNISVLNNTLNNIVSQAMNARNANFNSVTCMDLQGNDTVANYVLDAVIGSFSLTSASQTIVFDPAAGRYSDPGTCPAPIF
jgi:hypothetical protein